MTNPTALRKIRFYPATWETKDGQWRIVSVPRGYRLQSRVGEGDEFVWLDEPCDRYLDLARRRLKALAVDGVR